MSCDWTNEPYAPMMYPYVRDFNLLNNMLFVYRFAIYMLFSSYGYSLESTKSHKTAAENGG